MGRRLPLASLLVTGAACLALITGCGGGDDASSALDDALGYLPPDAPLVFIVTTDLEGDQAEAAGKIVDRFPFGGQLLESLKNEVEGDEIDFDDDIRPLLGNEVVLGVADPRDLLADDVGFVAALRTKDGDKLEDLVSEDAEEIGDEGDATLYRADEDFIAVDGDVAIAAMDEDALREAIKRREGDDRLREDDVEGTFEDLPKDAAVRVYGNVETLLGADESTAAARRVDWIDALTTFGATGSIEEDRIAIDFRVNTDGDDLAEEDLPIASGSESPPVIGKGDEIGGGIRNPAQIVQFAETVAQAVSPSGFADYERAKQQIAQGLNVDLDEDVIGQFTGDLSLAVDLSGNFAVRAQLENPRRFERTLERLARVIPSFAEGAGLGDVGVSRPHGDEDFYAVAGPGGEGIVYGVVDDVFVLANDARRAGDLASEQPEEVEGAEGAVVVRADAEQVAGALLSELGGFFQLGSAFTAPLGDLVGSLRADEDGLSGRLQLSIDR